MWYFDYSTLTWKHRRDRHKHKTKMANKVMSEMSFGYTSDNYP